MKTFSCAKASPRAVFVTHVTTRRFGLFINNEESVSRFMCFARYVSSSSIALVKKMHLIYFTLSFSLFNTQPRR